MGLPTDKIISCFYDSANDCVKVIDPSGTLLSFNPYGLEVMEASKPSDLIGKNWLDFWKDEMHPKAVSAFKDALAGRTGNFEGYCPTLKGTPKWWQVSIVPLKNEFGEVQWILAVSRDVTEMVQLREENKNLKAKLSASVITA